MTGQTGTSSSMTDVHDVSTIEVVTCSGVISGGIVTSGTTCWTCFGQSLRSVPFDCRSTYVGHEGLLD